MPPLAWLMVALVFGAAAAGFGRPAWRSYRARESRDLNTERYRAWRGHTVRGQPPPTREGMTLGERRRIYGAAAFGALALVALVAFFLTS
jgi:hypothetical protein